MAPDLAHSRLFLAGQLFGVEIPTALRGEVGEALSELLRMGEQLQEWAQAADRVQKPDGADSSDGRC